MSLSECFHAKIKKTNEGDCNVENLIKSYSFILLQTIVCSYTNVRWNNFRALKNYGSFKNL